MPDQYFFGLIKEWKQNEGIHAGHEESERSRFGLLLNRHHVFVCKDVPGMPGPDLNRVHPT